MIVLLVFIILTAGLLSQIRVEIRFNLHKSACLINICAALFFKIIKVHFLLKAEWSFDDGVRLLRVKRNGKIIALYVQERKKEEVSGNFGKWMISKWSDWAAMDRLTITGKVGIGEDAYETILLAGILKIVLDWSSVYYFPPNTDKKTVIHIVPKFNDTVFRLNLEGIINISPMQIIITAIKAVSLNERKYYYYVTPNREHYENNYGAN